MVTEKAIDVLLVDDDPDDVFLVRELLEEIPNLLISVEVAKSFHEALPLMKENEHDVYLLDYRLGIESGIELLRQYTPEGPVIMLTGQTDEGVDVEALQAGAADYLTKDQLTADTLARSIRYSIERRSYQKMLKESRERLEIALQASRVGTWILDPNNNSVVWDEHLIRLMGIEPENVPKSYDSAYSVIHEEDRESIRELVEHAANTSSPFESEFRVTFPDGSLRYLAVRGDSISSHHGGQKRLAGACWDVTERRRDEEHRKLLLAELDHRVKNTLQLVLALARQSLRQTNSITRFMESFEGRLLALADMHSLLTRTSWRGVSLREMISLCIRPYLSNDGEAISIDGPMVKVPPTVAQLLYLVFHELTTNAAKYGSLSVEGGELEIRWGFEEKPKERVLGLHWEEKKGPSVKVPEKLGFGSKLINQTLQYELQGVVEHRYEPNGVVCSIEIPVSRL